MLHEPGRHGPGPRRHGEVHLLRPAHRADAASARASAGRKIGGDEVVTACQQACPAEAIVFGNLNDPASRGRAQARRRAALRPPPRARHPPAHRLPRQAPEPQPRARMSTTTSNPGRRRSRSRPRRSWSGRPDDRALTESLLAAGARAGAQGLARPLRRADGRDGLLVLCLYDRALQGHRRLGQQHPRRLGLRHHQLRLVDRHRPRRHAHQRHPPPLPAEVAHLHQPLRRGDDPLRGGDGRASSRSSTSGGRGSSGGSSRTRRRPSSGRTSRARSPGTSSRSPPTSPSRSSSGTWGSSPTSRRCATRRRSRTRRIVYGIMSLRLARLGPRTGSTGASATCSSPGSRRRSSSRSTPSSPSTSPSRSCRAGTPPSSRPTSSPAPSSAASRWCSPS